MIPLVAVFLGENGVAAYISSFNTNMNDSLFHKTNVINKNIYSH